MSFSLTARMVWLNLSIIEASVFATGATVTASAGASSRPSGSGRRAGQDRENYQFITTVNTHETVASTGLDNSHDTVRVPS